MNGERVWCEALILYHMSCTRPDSCDGLIQLAQTLGVRDAHSTELAAPFVKGRIRDATLTAQIDNANASLSMP